jgi:hypothetical protein
MEAKKTHGFPYSSGHAEVQHLPRTPWAVFSARHVSAECRNLSYVRVSVGSKTKSHLKPIFL